MYTVMIVEDEMLVRLGLKKSVDWDKYNMKVIADVGDGDAAWEVYERSKPNIIITDLKMPGISGMELIEKIRKNDNITSIIILSCMEEFDLVRRAMSLGVYEYIPKLSMTEQEFDTILNKVRKKLDEQSESGAIYNLTENDTDIIKERLIKNFLIHRKISTEDFMYQTEKMNLRLHQARLVISIMIIDDYVRLKEMFSSEDETEYYLKCSMLSTLNRLLAESGRGEVFHLNNVQYILIFSFNDVYSERNIQQVILNIISNIKIEISKAFNASISFGISSIQNGYDSLSKLLEEAFKALNQKYVLGTGIYHIASTSEYRESLNKKINALRNFPKLLMYLDTVNIGEYNSLLDEIQYMEPVDINVLRKFFLRLFQWTSTSIKKITNNHGEVFISYIFSVSTCENLDEFIKNYTKFVLETTENIKRNVFSKEVSNIIQYINNHYQNDISLQQIAEHVGLTQSYVSNKIKKELKVSFIDYLNRIRVEKAMNLLRDNYLKLYEIAEKVGFTENTYFSKVFKKYTGISPYEFRKQWIKESLEEIESERN